MPTLTLQYQATQTLTVTGLGTLANGALALSPAQSSGSWTDFVVRASLTSGSGATAGGLVAVTVRGSIDGVDYDDDDDERTLGIVLFPAAGAQTRSATFLVAGAETLPPSWILGFRNASGAALTAATVTYRGLTKQTGPDVPAATGKAFSSGFSTGFS